MSSYVNASIYEGPDSTAATTINLKPSLSKQTARILFNNQLVDDGGCYFNYSSQYDENKADLYAFFLKLKIYWKEI